MGAVQTWQVFRKISRNFLYKITSQYVLVFLLTILSVIPVFAAFTTTSLIVSLNLDENTGTAVVDSSGSGNSGVVSGSPTWSSGSITFDGSDDKITVLDATSLDSATHTYEVWYTMPSSGDWAGVSSQFSRLIDKVPADALSGTNIQVNQSTRTVRAYFGGAHWSSATVGSVSTNFLISANTLDYSTKYHIVFTYNDTTRIGRIYVDNVLVASATAGAAYTANDANLTIGGNPYDNTRNIRGTVHRVSVYSSELTATEVGNNYVEGSDYNHTYSNPPSSSLTTVTASPTTMPANGTSTSTVTVTVLNSSSTPVQNTTVRLTSSRGAQDVITPTIATTNSSGVATFSVKSSNTGTGTYTATAGGIGITDTAAVTFTGGIITTTGITHTSTLDALSLEMDVSYNASSSALPVVLLLHGHTTTVPDGIIQRFATKGVFAIRTYKRGFGNSQGSPDDGGKEVYDFRDAVEYVKNNYGQYIDEDNINVIGYSGGGGNTYGLITRFPDYFNTATVFFGMSDYGYNSTYGWYTNGATGTQQTIMQTRIGGTPASVLDNYYSRAFYLGAKNNPYTNIQLFYDTAETNVPQSHATQYTTVSGAEGFTNVTTRISTAATTTTDLDDNLSTNLAEWLSLGAGATDVVWNGSGQRIDWTTDRNSTYDSLYKKLDSLRNYSKTDRFKTTFTFTVASTAGNNALTLIGFRNSSNTSLKNAVSLVIGNVSGTLKPYIRIDYDGTALNSTNRTLQIFTNSLTLNETYNFELEVNNGVLTGILKNSSGTTIETQTINFDGSKTFTSIDSFGVSNFNDNSGALLQTGTLDTISVSAWTRWYHGYPEEGNTGEPLITAENYILPAILAGTTTAPVLNSSDQVFVPGYMRTQSFQVMLGNGTNEAANMTYDVSGSAASAATAKTFTLEGLTGVATVDLTVYNLQASTQYTVVDTNLTAGGSTTGTATTNSSGTLSYSGSLGSTHKFEVYKTPSATTTTSTSSQTATNNNGSSAPPSGCTDQKPGSAPSIFQVDRKGSVATLYITPPGNPYSSFSVLYGTGTASDQHADSFTKTDSSGVVVHQIKQLNPKSTYSFKVRAMNGCTPGDWSGIVTVSPKRGTYYAASKQAVRTASLRASGTKSSTSVKENPPKQSSPSPASPVVLESKSAAATENSTAPTNAHNPQQTKINKFFGWVKGLFEFK